eukprot:TRINITY_DN7263_c0_g1_i1.p1 TRINITY_DN7263_c0_g1~~TRINITY_DN7263_c0_g1_i1.p1  ORF type:complete len:115 (-),score=14.03 TRINITY_DN7263_c0_g1_i1:18-362(-)
MPFIVPLSSSSCFVFLNTQTPKKKEKHYTTPQKYTTHYQKTHTHTTTITHPPTPLSDNILPPLTLPHSCVPVSYTHLRAHETPEHLVCRLLLEKKKNKHKHKEHNPIVIHDHSI